MDSMFGKLTLSELEKLWKTLESSVYHQADFYGLGTNPMWFDHGDIFWDVATEIDSRGSEGIV